MAITRNSSPRLYEGMYKLSVTAAWQPYVFTAEDFFEQASNSHSSWINGVRHGDAGGPWMLVRRKVEHSPYYANTNVVQGPMIISTGGDRFFATTPDPDPTKSTDSTSDFQMKKFGTESIARSAPTNPSFSLSTFIGEMREGLPKAFGSGLYKEKTKFLKGSSSEYLNVEFGWKPMVSDIQKFARTVQKSGKIIEQYRAASGTRIRRRRALEPSRSAREGNIVPTFQPGAHYYGKGTGYELAEASTWFSGAFKYHVPIGDDPMSKLNGHISSANKLLGVKLTPDTLWNLAPWSWGIDWFSNTGQIMTNISNLGTDGLIMEYGYAMSHVRKESGMTATMQNSLMGVASNRRVVEIKKRIQASPYSFNVSFDGLSNRQKAVAAAVGITRR